MTKPLTFYFLLSVSLWGQGPRGGFYPGMAGGRGAAMLSRTPVTGAPYAALRTTQTQRVLSDGNQILRTEQEQVYRDAQGRTRVERTATPPASSGKQPFTEVTIVDPVAGYRYVLNSSNLTAIQIALPAQSSTGTSGTPPVRTGPAGNVQITTVELGTQTINGVPATGKQVTGTIPAGTAGNSQPIVTVRTTWISNDLKVPVQMKTSDPRFGTMDMELTNIQQTAPDPSLFLVPLSYTIKTGRAGAAFAGRLRTGR